MMARFWKYSENENGCLSREAVVSQHRQDVHHGAARREDPSRESFIAPTFTRIAPLFTFKRNFMESNRLQMKKSQKKEILRDGRSVELAN